MKRFFLLLSCCLLTALQGLAAPLFRPGSGVVAFNAYKPFADRPVNIYYHFPETADPATAQVLMLIPGAGRDAKPLLDAVRDKLDAVNVIAFSLEFPADTYPVREYQEVGIRDKDGHLKKPADRTVQLPDRIFEFIKAHSAIRAARYDMIGHSAGGQFIHRFLLFHDSPYVDRAVVGAPGWFTFPDPSQPYPYGLKETDRASDEVIARFLGKKMILQVGALDTDRGGVLRKTPEADAQGINRLDRARTFFAYLRKEAQRLAVPFSWTYCEVPGVGHNSGQMAVYAMETLYCPGAGNSVFDVYQAYTSLASTVPVRYTAPTDWLHRYDKEVAAFGTPTPEEAACDVLLLGSSSIVFWNTVAEDLAPLKTVRRGYGGSTLRDQLVYFDRLTAGYHPKAVVIYCDNDLCGNADDLTPLQYCDLYRVFCGKLQEVFPEAQLYLLSIKYAPLQKNTWGKKAVANELLKEYAAQERGIHFVDVTTPMLDENGQARDEFFAGDALHLSPEGYAVWTSVLRPLLEKYAYL